MNIIITGNKGLIGSKLQERFSLFNEVEGVDKSDSEKLKSKDSLYKTDLIIHCAANCLIRNVIAKPREALENIESTYYALEIARKYEAKFVYFSSSRIEHNKFNPYIASKRAGEELVKAYHSCYGIEYLIIRPETVWGLKDNKERVIPNWINKAIKGEPLVVYGDANKELSPIYVDDFCNELIPLIQEWEIYKNKTCSISGQVRKVKDIIKDILEVTKSSSEIKYLDAEKTQPQECIPADLICKKDFKTTLENVLKNNYLGGRK